VGKPKLDWAGLIDREKDLISGIPNSLAETLKERGVELIREQAKFIGPNEVEAGNRRIEAKQIVIVTGSKLRPLPIPGAELMITSDEVLSERKLPNSMLLVVVGVIALEFGNVYARTGCNVTILEVLPRLLPGLDEDAVAVIRKESERIGIDVQTGVKVKRVEKTNKRLHTVFQVGRQVAFGQERPGSQRHGPHPQCGGPRSRGRQRRA
jgi:glutathione reductase (NADPH)